MGKNTYFGHFTYFSHIFRFFGIFEDILAIYILKCFSNANLRKKTITKAQKHSKSVQTPKMNSVKATKWLTELNICDKNPFEYNSVTKKFWCKPCKKAISADQKSQLKQHRESEKHRSNSVC